MSPSPSTATSEGSESPRTKSVVWQLLLLQPAGSSTTWLLERSGMNTSPKASTVTDAGAFNPLVGSVIDAPGPNAIAGALPSPRTKVVASTVPTPSSWTAPHRAPDASG